MKNSEHAVQQKRDIHQRLEYVDTILRWHKIMLCWIEKCRLAMNPLPPISIEKGSDDQNSFFSRQRRSKRRDTLAVFEKVKVSKFTSKCPNTQTRAFKATISKHISVASTVTKPNSIQQKMSKRRKIKSRRVKEKAFDQFFSQMMTKANRFVNTEIKSQSRTQRNDDGQTQGRTRRQRRSATQRPHSTPRIIKTRSQRISRKPLR